MSFASETEKLVNELIQAEYKNACDMYGDKFNSLHEGYAVLKEEVEEVVFELSGITSAVKGVWAYTKANEFDEIISMIKQLERHTNNLVKEIAQVGAVSQKLKNTLEVEKKCIFIIHIYL